MSVALSVHLGPLLAMHRGPLEEIVRATGVFVEDEVTVALELFDDAMGGGRDYEFVGAFEDEQLVGYACFGPTPSTEDTFDLYWIAVHPSGQRSGAGGALMEDVEHRLQTRQARLLVVETSSRDDYAPTRRFYEKRGYCVAAQLRDFYNHGDDRVVLTKRLSAAPS